MTQLASKWRLYTHFSIGNAVRLIPIILLFASACWAQIPQGGDTTSTPIPDAGHDYIHAPVETVNPANGSVSVRIPVRMPSGREITIPFSFAYDSNGAFYYGTGPGYNTPGYVGATTAENPFGQGGWSYSFPVLSFQLVTWTNQNPETLKDYTCNGGVNYVFQDPTGNRHGMALSVAPTTAPGSGDSCSDVGGQGGEVTTGGEGPILATTTTPSYPGIDFPPVTVTDGNGTVYTFPGGNTTTGYVQLGSLVDRNGNELTLSNSGSAVTYKDTVGRTAVSTSGLGGSPDTVTVSGLNSPYDVYWTTASASFTINVDNIGGTGAEACPTSMTGSTKPVSKIVLPNGQEFTFAYDPTYGMLNKITYPTGGYVRYVWGLNSQAEAGFWSTNSTQGPVYFNCIYDFPAITDRYVSFNGSTEVLHQHFAYSTNWGTGENEGIWTSKQTIVTTTDEVRGTTSTTVYSYSPLSPDPVPSVQSHITNNVPVEQCIEYYDTSGSGGTPPSPCPNVNPSGKLLRTVIKNWKNIRLETSEQTTLDNGKSALKIFCYNNSEQVTEENEYDYGTGSISLPSCAQGWTQTGVAGGSLLRETLTNYASFTGNNIVDLPSSVVTYNGSGTRVAETDSSYDQTTPQTTSVVQHTAAPGGSARGNLTTVTKQCFQGSSGCGQGNSTTTYSYYDTGQIYQMTDPCGNVNCSDMTGTGHTTTYSYTDSYSSCGGTGPSGSTNAFLTQVTYPATNGVSHIEKYCYGYPAGLLRGSTDENNETTIYGYSDSLDRLTEITYPDGGATSVSYDDAPPTPSMTVEKEITSGVYLTTVTTDNGMGMPTETQLTTDPSGTDITLTAYDGLGRQYTVTNPYRSASDPTYGVTTYTYDALGRTTQVLHPDGSKITTAYTGAATEVSDEGNGTKSVQRISQADGLGRMVSVCEVSSATQQGTSGTPAACGQDISGTGFFSSYVYDTLGNMLSVSQGSLGARTFTYDSLSHLVTSTNPESGLASYTYDSNSNVASRTEPEENQTEASDTVTTSYVYDVLDRMTAKEYSDETDNVDFNYDETSPWGTALTNTVGRLTTEYDGNTGSDFGYDPMGRINENDQCTPQNCGTGDFPLSYTYNLLGDIATSTDGQYNQFTDTYNGAGQLTTLTSSYSDANHPGTLFSQAVYNAPGELTSAKLGNGINETRAYNDRLRMTSLAAGSVYTLGMSSYAPNGDVLGVNDSSNGTWTYTYDDFNRLMGSSCSSHCPDGEGTQGFSYTYDRYANRWTQTVTAGSGGTSNLSFTGNNNHIDGYSYDAAGNLMSDGQHTYYYDAEHELIQVDGTEGWCASNTGTAATACYTYDGEGQRVRRTVPGSGITDDYLYDLSGTYITQMSGAGWWIRGEIYAGGRHLGTYENDLSTPTTFFTHADWLGTERVETAVNGTSCESIVSVAFGDGLSTSGSCDPSAKYYTGKERDWESNLDNFEARYYSSQLGRFMSADWSAVPAPVPYATFTNPQTLNLYAIVSDNPETFADLDGHSPQQDCLVDVCQSGMVDQMNEPVGEPNTGDGTQQSNSQQAAGAAASQQQSAQQQSDQQNQAQQQNATGTLSKDQCAAAGCGGMAKVPDLASAQPPTVSVKDALIFMLQAVTVVSAVFDEGASLGALPEEEGLEAGAEAASADTQLTSAEKNTLEGAQDNLESLEKNQQIQRSAGRPHAIESTGKSAQRLKNALRNIKSSKDLPPED